MTDYPTDMCAAADDAPSVTEEVCICQVCHTEWASRGPADKEGCSFCGAPAKAIIVISEAANDYGAVIT